ncbi:putative periplasmic protein (plasmid) [Sinorhizobium fredii NGR234]|uniref:Periplasmic protein n=1 Tax=Sinorhizobium fredii (strain NBRC 101917 / NGR234) TaxID=394 RepID=Q6W1E2_SINFN|nr:DUF2092 domain-containing protein [Sinorhizobium fredii]AAQ87426.1 Hypothetical protein RNGR00300 [Sinorhizobium fredii NGR234]ACP21966.1 putative periplasmic protein [Sinorhizobium fredii NGR234]
MNNSRSNGPPSTARPKRARLASLTFLVALAVSSPALAEGEDAKQILKAMSDYVTSQQHIQLQYDVDIEVITPHVEKLQFASSGHLKLSRPDKLRATRSGGYTDVEVVFDGKTATVLGKDSNTFTQLDARGSIDQMIDRLRTEHYIELPGADLLLSNLYDELVAGVIEAKYIGHGVVDGAECEHLAFRNQETDWQLWVERGNAPIPRKYVITSKTLAAAPQYTLRIKAWDTDTPLDAKAFTFEPPAGAKSVDVTALADIGELPPPAEVMKEQ